MKTESPFHRIRALVTAAALGAFFTVVAPFATPLSAKTDNDTTPNDAPFKAINVIGDSLSDTGRTFAAIGVPPPPYFNGRTSNGPLWIEYFAPSLRLTYNPLDNFSWA